MRWEERNCATESPIFDLNDEFAPQSLGCAQMEVCPRGRQRQ